MGHVNLNRADGKHVTRKWWAIGAAAMATLSWIYLAVAILRVSDRLPALESAYYRGSVLGPGVLALAASTIAVAIPGRSLVRLLATYAIVLGLGLVHLGRSYLDLANRTPEELKAARQRSHMEILGERRAAETFETVRRVVDDQAPKPTSSATTR
jgi:hypothetical protein